MNENSWLTAFVDETGTNELDSTKTGVSHLFICVAVIVNSVGLVQTESKMKEISQKLCGDAEIKSNRIGTDHQKRLKYLSEIQDLPFGYYALIINKDRIPKASGFKYKRSFYKNINRMLYQQLQQSGNNLRLIADEIGGKDFMDSFVPYLEKQGLPSLFTRFEHYFAKSGQTPLIQLADLIAGTLSYCFDQGKQCEYSPHFREILRKKEVGIQCWPLQIVPVSDSKPTNQSEWDAHLKSTATNRAISFIEKHDNDADIDCAMQASVLRQLLFSQEFEEQGKQATFSDKLIEQLQNEGFEKLSRQAFSSRVIGKIRDSGIILSGSNEGYRLALSTSDIQDYLNHDRNIMEPMIYRLLQARGTVKLDTANQIDILEHSNYMRLKKLADMFNDHTIELETKQIPPEYLEGDNERI